MNKSKLYKLSSKQLFDKFGKKAFQEAVSKELVKLGLSFKKGKNWQYSENNKTFKVLNHVTLFMAEIKIKDVVDTLAAR